MTAIWSWIISLLLMVCTYIGYLAYQNFKRFRLFKDLGIAGPDPSIVSGNMKQLRTGSKLPVETMMRWQKQYGKVFGYFRGTFPTLVVADLELMKHILIKDVNNFVNRPRMPWNFKPTADSLIGLRDDDWRDVRRTLSPTFSTSKMKQLTGIMNKTVSIFCSEVEKMAEKGQEFDIYDKFQRLTLEVIGECALAMRIECQTVEKDFTLEAVRLFLKGPSSGIAGLILTCFPWLSVLLKPYIRRLPVIKMVNRLLENVAYVIQKRRENPEKYKTVDVLQLMLDAGQGHELLAEEEDGVVDRVVKSSQRKPLTDGQIVGNSWIFLLGGFETTSTTLAYTVHCLVTNPDVQEKVYQEIVSNIQDDKIPTYDDAHNLQYLDQVINETLRVYPPVVLFMTRECAHDYDLNGIIIPAGMKVEIPIYSIHHDPELWPDPEKFDPERFSPENKGKIHSMAHIPFGAGPRNCIGMRFALLEAKLTLIRLVRNYRLLPSSKTKDPPDVTVPHATFTPKNGIYLKVEKRK